MRDQAAAEPGWGSRLIGGLMAMFLAAVSVISLPWLIFWKYPIRAGLLLGLPFLALIPLFYVWVLVVALVALIIGMRLGVYDMLDVLNLLWGTGDSYNPKLQALAASLRSYVLISGLLTYLLLCLR